MEAKMTTDETDEQLLGNAFPSLPDQPVKDLLSAGVCTRCVCRLFGLQGPKHYCSNTPSSSMHAIVEESILCSLHEVANMESKLCPCCLGIFQFVYLHDKGILVKKNFADNYADSIIELIKREDYQTDSFCVEVSLPSVILQNEHVICSFLKKKFGSELWFQRQLFAPISTKDALKITISDSLESLLEVKSSPCSFRIRLTFTTASQPGEALNGENGFEKKRKTGNKLEPGSESHVFPFEPVVIQPLQLNLLCCRGPIYFGGRYNKFSRNVSQTRWIIGDERKGEASVQEIIGSNILAACRGDDFKFHAAGREDMDVRMLGSGRPFVVEIQNARQIPSETSVRETESKINSMDSKLIAVKNITLLPETAPPALMREGEVEKQKQYCALVWISRILEDSDLKAVALFKNLSILQQTPIRVLHRRSPLEREKTIHWMKIEHIAETSQYFLLHLCAEAGTYIKEFVHGDMGRTHPSLGTILSCRAEIVRLDVTAVKMDCFLE